MYNGIPVSFGKQKHAAACRFPCGIDIDYHIIQ